MLETPGMMSPGQLSLDFTVGKCVGYGYAPSIYVNVRLSC